MEVSEQQHAPVNLSLEEGSARTLARRLDASWPQRCGEKNFLSLSGIELWCVGLAARGWTLPTSRKINSGRIAYLALTLTDEASDLVEWILAAKWWKDMALKWDNIWTWHGKWTTQFRRNLSPMLARSLSNLNMLTDIYGNVNRVFWIMDMLPRSARFVVFKVVLLKT
jgi:hypothetical protein